MDPHAFSHLSFDCYGTLIDWESGLLAALRPLLARHQRSVEDEALLATFAEIESTLQQRPPFRSYRQILTELVAELGRRADFQPSPAECAALADSIADWPAFADTPAALQRLAIRYRLIIASNIDPDLFALSQAHLGVEFDRVITAAEVRSYKPALGHFQALLATVAKPALLHCAQSRHHDIAPTRALGIASVWVHRGRTGTGGATQNSRAEADHAVASLAELADWLGA